MLPCIATTPINLGGHTAGNSLRNALANVMRRTTYPESHGDGRHSDPSPEHKAGCSACWLLTYTLDPGTIVRADAFIPPIPSRTHLQPGYHFAFALTLFGDGFRYLLYFVLAISEAEQHEGIGPGRRDGPGRFQVESITAFEIVICLTLRSYLQESKILVRSKPD